MAISYHFDPHTLSVRRADRGFRFWLRRSGRYILQGVLLGLVFFYIFISLVPSPENKRLREQQKRLNAELLILQRQQEQASLVLADLRQRDANLYRVLFLAQPLALDSLPSAVRRMDYYEQLGRMTGSELAAEITLASDRIDSSLYAQIRSYEELYEMARDQENRLQHIPSIQPVFNADLRRMASGYGVRIDPVYHVRRFHAGIDFAAPTGTEVMATADGTVVFVGWRQGYGNTVVVDHGYGYTTLYAHLYKAVARRGQRVHRGDIIALLGNTGKSTGPHLHYEVRIADKPVDPRNYFFYDLSPEDYDRMIQISTNYGTIMD